MTPRIIKPEMKYDDIKKEASEPKLEYDDWIERRDGMRDCEGKEREEKEKKKFPYKQGGKRRCQKI